MTNLLIQRMQRARKSPYRNLVIDVGAGEGEFAEQLKTRYPGKEIIAIDAESISPQVQRAQMGWYFNVMNEQDAKRLHAIWMNHVNITNKDSQREFGALAKKLKPGVPVIITIRKKNLEYVKKTLDAAGLVIKAKRVLTPELLNGKRAIASNYTQKYVEESRIDSSVQPLRIIAMKPKNGHVTNSP